MSTGMHWSEEERAFAQQLLKNGAFLSDVAFRLKRMFKKERNTKSIRQQIEKGKLIGYGPEAKEAREAKVVSLFVQGHSLRDIADRMEMGFRRVRELCRGQRPNDPRFHVRSGPHEPLGEFAGLYVEDPIADTGVSLLDLRPGQCRWPVARDPENKSQRFCGEKTELVINRNFTRKPYCECHSAMAYLKTEAKVA